MRIVIRGPAELHDDEFEPVTDPASLAKVDGLVGAAGEAMSDYFEGAEPLASLGLTGGDLRLVRAGSEGLEVVTEYLAPRRLEDDELAALVDFTEGQWSDGMGTHLYDELEALGVEGLNISCKPLGSDGQTSAEQLPD